MLQMEKKMRASLHKIFFLLPSETAESLRPHDNVIMQINSSEPKATNLYLGRSGLDASWSYGKLPAATGLSVGGTASNKRDCFFENKDENSFRGLH